MLHSGPPKTHRLQCSLVLPGLMFPFYKVYLAMCISQLLVQRPIGFLQSLCLSLQLLPSPLGSLQLHVSFLSTPGVRLLGLLAQLLQLMG